MNSPDSAGPCLLVVDDNVDNRDMLNRRLRRLGYTRLLQAEDGVEALERLRAAMAGDGVDVVLLDVMMPRMSGIEVLEAMAADPRLRAVPVLMISADTDTDTMIRCIELGAEDYLPKPFNPTLLKARLGSVVEKKRLRDAVHQQFLRLERELREARRQQLSMLPDTFPDGGPDHAVSIDAVMHPAREVGGDFYDCFEAVPGYLCLAIGDVSDKGVSAALFMARTRSLLRSSVLQHVEVIDTVPPPSYLVHLMNEELCKNNPACMFVTLLVGFLNLRTGAFAYVNAGHLRPWILDAAGRPRTVVSPPGPPLGAMPDIMHPDQSVELGLGETLVLVTDGLPEMTDPNGDFYTMERVEADLAETVGLGPGGLVRELARRVQAFAAQAPAADDVTILALRRDA